MRRTLSCCGGWLVFPLFRIVEYFESEGTPEDHQVQLPKKSNHMSESSVRMLLELQHCRPYPQPGPVPSDPTPSVLSSDAPNIRSATGESTNLHPVCTDLEVECFNFGIFPHVR